MHVILDTNGLVLKKQRKCFLLESKKIKKRLSPLRVRTITVTADSLISASAVRLAGDHEIPIFYSSKTGRVYAKMYSPKFVASELTRTKQTFFQWLPQALQWIQYLIRLKTEHQNDLIRRYNKTTTVDEFIQLQQPLLDRLSGLRYESGRLDIQQILTIEAQLGANYWRTYYALFSKRWAPGARSQRPAADPVNAVINYFYGFNYALVEHAIYLAGLNPYSGMLHQNRYNDPVLSFDLIEPFRPVCDEFVLQQFSSEKVKSTYFDFRKAGVYLNRRGKQALIPAFYDYLDQPLIMAGEQTSYRNHIYRFADRLRKTIDQIDLNDLLNQL